MQLQAVKTEIKNELTALKKEIQSVLNTIESSSFDTKMKVSLEEENSDLLEVSSENNEDKNLNLNKTIENLLNNNDVISKGSNIIIANNVYQTYNNDGLDETNIEEVKKTTESAIPSLDDLITTKPFVETENKNIEPNSIAALDLNINSNVIQPLRESSLERIDSSIRNAVEKASEKYSIDEALIYKVIETESSFRKNTVSSSGAEGLMQLMPKTAEYLGVNNSFNVEENILGGTKYLRQMLDKHDGNLTLALAAYNAGPGNVSKYGGVPPFKETQNYIKKILI